MQEKKDRLLHGLNNINEIDKLEKLNITEKEISQNCDL